jgi:hypothetical protein
MTEIIVRRVAVHLALRSESSLDPSLRLERPERRSLSPPLIACQMGEASGILLVRPEFADPPASIYAEIARELQPRGCGMAGLLQPSSCILNCKCTSIVIRMATLIRMA